MEALLDALYGSALAEWMRVSRWGYASINGAHILGLSLLVGGIVPLDLRLVGAWRDTPVEVLARILVPVAACGLVLAATTGFALFATRATEYAALPLFLVKMALVAFGTLHALVVHARGPLVRAGPGAQRRIGVTSMVVWIAVLACGRLLGFVAD